VLDVREPYEFPRARFPGDRVAYAPLSELARKHLEALPEPIKGNKSAPLVVVCATTAYAAPRSPPGCSTWAGNQVYNLAGGIDDYARKVDPDIGFVLNILALFPNNASI
jgi:rhodanese-related sulfurtransferase